MDPRGQGWYEHNPQYQRPDRRDEPYQSHHPEQQGHYPPPDARERDRWRYAADPRYMHYMSNPPPAPEFTYSSQGYTPSRTRPVSRQAYAYPPQSYWDYRDDFGYYDHGYYRGHYGYSAGSDGSGWPVQGGWRMEGYQEWMGASYTHQHGHEFRRDSGLTDGVSAKESMENGTGAGESFEPGGLASSKTSGLSSSTYELSQYINGAEQSETAPPARSEPEAEYKSTAPLKFCVPHVAVSFGPAGQLVRVTPALPSHGEPAQVELHSMEVILSDTQEQSDMRDFPGPLTREDLHKVDAINFGLQMAEACLKNGTGDDTSSASLLWQLLVLLCRQNGRIVGSDIAELLVRGSRSTGERVGDGEQSDVCSLIDLSETPTPETQRLDTADLLTGNPLTNEETSEQNIQNYTKLLLAGRKKEALESAMRSGLWGHALFLASKMDSRAYNTVLNRFTSSLFSSDTLQTLFQFLSGRIPAVATSYSREKWGDWRPHLAVLLSNETADSAIHRKSIVTLGDTLASRGLLHAAHICYLTAHTPFGWYTNKMQRLVLLGSSHSVFFAEFCCNSAIRCTEVFEYCQRLGDPTFVIPSFQVYKFLYACRLLDCGLTSQAFHYCELVAKALLTLPEPHMVLLEEVVKLVDRLKHSEAQLETGADPDWLVLLRQRLQGCQIGKFEGNVSAQGENLNQPDNVSTGDIIHSTLPDDSQNGAAEDCSDQSQSAAQHQSPYPSVEQSHNSYQTEQSYPSHPLEQQSYQTETQSHVAEEQLPQIYAPVPMYAQQNVSFPGSPPIPALQDVVNYPDSLYHQSASGLDLRSYSDADADFPSGANTVDASENGASLEENDSDTKDPPEADLKETTGQKLVKESKSGWFSGWFRSKPKETPQEQNTQITPEKSVPIPTFSTPPMVSPSMPPSYHQAPGINPFSRRAGQKPSTTVGLNLGSMSQSP